MGTSGAYGGSGSSGWGAARDAVAAIPADAGESGATQSGGNEVFDDAVADAAAAIADAMVAEEPGLGRAPSDYPISNLLPRIRVAGGGGGGGGGGGAAGVGRTRGSSRTGGRTGGSSRRNMAPGAQRGGLALGAAYALRNRDRAGLAAVGLDLAMLEALPPASRVSRILDAILGPATHPDEQVLREAAVEQVKAIVMAEVPPSISDAIRDFVATYIWKMGMLELRAQYPGGLPAADVLLKRERELKNYIRARIRSVTVPAAIAAGNLKIEAAKILRDVLRVLRAGRTAT
jgi:hypothetical protein